MASLDPELAIKPIVAIPSGLYSAATGSGPIDVGSFEFAVLRTMATVVSGNVEVLLQERSDDTEAWTDVSGTTQTLTSADNNAVTPSPQVVRLAARKAQVRVVATPSTANQAFSVLVDLVNPSYGADQDVAYLSAVL